MARSHSLVEQSARETHHAASELRRVTEPAHDQAPPSRALFVRQTEPAIPPGPQPLSADLLKEAAELDAALNVPPRRRHEGDVDLGDSDDGPDTIPAPPWFADSAESEGEPDT